MRNRITSRSELFSNVTTDKDLAGDANTKYTPNGYTLINTNPYYFVRSGNVNGSTLYNFAGNGYYWSSTAANASLAYGLYYGSGGVWPAYRGGRLSGWSLRCVAGRRINQCAMATMA